MSIMSSRSMLIATGVAVCAVAAAVQPVRSWALRRNVAHAAVAQRCSQGVTIYGQYPDVDIQVIDDYSGTRRGNPQSRIRVHMDIRPCQGKDLDGVRKALNNSTDNEADRKNILEEIEKATPVDSSDKGKGTSVIKAALGLLHER